MNSKYDSLTKELRHEATEIAEKHMGDAHFSKLACSLNNLLECLESQNFILLDLQDACKLVFYQHEVKCFDKFDYISKIFNLILKEIAK